MNEPTKPMETVTEMQVRKPLTARPRRNKDTAWVRTTFLVPRPTHDRLRTIALQRQTSVQQLLEEAMDAWLITNGEPAFYPDGWADLTKRAVLK